jgi:hypothetical protein
MGPWGIAIAILLGASFTKGGREVFRKVTRQVIKTGYVLSDKGTDALGDLKEKTADMIAEIKAEQSENGDHAKKPASKHKKSAAHSNDTEE